ncbi:MAG: hypothetical protein A2Y38_25115 [Spirochaetes bacterium GWB1_59_5]|nr:MAG: hypothetical protein A2Y38_25115 [Spirochaetes bacterium GWB1_59_5]
MDYRWEKILRAIRSETGAPIAECVRLLFERRADLDLTERKIIEETAAAIQAREAKEDGAR